MDGRGAQNNTSEKSWKNSNISLNFLSTLKITFKKKYNSKSQLVLDFFFNIVFKSMKGYIKGMLSKDFVDAMRFIFRCDSISRLRVCEYGSK